MTLPFAYNDKYNTYSQLLDWNQLPVTVMLGLLESTLVPFDNPVKSQSDKQFIGILDNTPPYINSEDHLKEVD